MNSVKPCVTLVAKTEFFPPDFVPWTPDVDGGQALAEFAGRACYQSWKRPNPATATNAGYIKHILEVGHYCYDELTDVLTSDGWKNWADVSEEDFFATRTVAGELEYHQAAAFVSEDYSGPMVRVESAGVDLLVTPNHRMLACPTTTVRGRAKLDYSLIPASELVGTAHAYIKTATWSGGDSEFLSVDEARLLGFIVGDGNVGARGHQVKFRLKKIRKIEWLLDLCSRNGWPCVPSGENRWAVTPSQKLVNLMRETYGEDKQRQIPDGVLCNLTFEASEALLDGLICSDGHIGKSTVSFATTSQVLRDQVQHLALHAGLASNIGSCIPAGKVFIINENNAELKHDLYTQNVIRRNLRPEVGRTSTQVGKSYVTEYNGMIYCATVPNNTLYVRRNGIPVWSGNSVLEHGTASFYLTGISRSFTHELVRHRHLSYSQLSQRYVDGRRTGVVVPDVIAEDSDCESAFNGAMQAASDAYVYLLDMLDRKFADHPDGTSKKKQVRQAARSVLPNATETKIVVTGNYRAWRHFIHLRATEAADVEIREVAVTILELLQWHAANVFADFTISLLPDGTRVASSPYAEVS